MNPHFFTAPFCLFVSHLSQLLDTGKQRCGIRNYFKHLDRKIPEWGIFYFACFSKNGRNHSGEWFDFRQKVLKTSIKSIHGQQMGK